MNREGGSIRESQKRKPVLLFVCNHFLPGRKAGGPLVSLLRIISLFSSDAHVYVLTKDRDFEDANTYPNIVVDRLNYCEGIAVFYVRSIAGVLRCLRSLNPDVVYFNSFFSPFSFVSQLACLALAPKARRILAPRGELGIGALKIKAYRKRLFVRVFRSLGMQRMLKFQATSESEAADIGRELREPAVVVPNIPARMPSAPRRRVKFPGKGKLIYLSRITRKKNLHLALIALSSLSNCEIEFDIFGPIEDTKYWRECMREVAEIPSTIRIRYLGAIHPREVTKVLPQYHALFLPTANENYGHTIFEALQHGVLPLISDQTPWRNLTSLDIGWDVSLSDPQHLIWALEQFLGLNQEEFDRKTLNAMHFASTRIDFDSLCGTYHDLFGIG